MNNYDLLIHRLDAFIRKYYANKLIRGILIFLGSFLAFYLVVSVSEYYLYFPTWVRYTVLSLFIGLGSFALIGLILIPLLQITKLGKVISHEKAAQIIGVHFPNVEDKLLNVLQLKQRINETASKELIEASIEQKTAALKPIPFQAAVNIAKNKKYLPLLLIPLLVGLFILFAAPNVFKESAKRLLSPSEKFIAPAPFSFELLTKKTSIPQFDDIEIEMKTNGRLIPENAYIIYNGQEVMMQKKENNLFAHTFYKVSKDFNFKFKSADIQSKLFDIKVLPNPVIKAFKIAVDYPDYTGRKDEILDNIGDIIAPQGTSLRWAFSTEHTDAVQLQLGKGLPLNMSKQSNQFFYSWQFMRDTNYSIIISNQQVAKKDSMHYNVSIIPDQFPSINVQQYNDSLTGEFVLFVGEAGDDYGVKNISLHYTIQKSNEKGQPIGAVKNGTISVPVKPATSVQFNHFLDVTELNLDAGDKLSYYFTACDNDAVNGSKCAKSVIFNYNKPTQMQLDSLVEETQEQITKDLNNTSKQSDKIDKEIKEMQEKMLQKNDLDWQDQKQMEEMMQRNENMQNQIEEIKKKFEQNNKQAEKKEYSEAIKEKQENVEKLLDELKNNQLNERMKKMEELMKLLNKDKVFEQLKQAEQDNKLMEKDLDRMVEMMKQLERDMRMEDIGKKAEELAKKQEELNKQTEQKSKSDEELKKAQDELNKEMDELKKEIDELKKLNESMENPENMDDMNKAAEDAEKEMKNSSSELSKGNKSKASKAQKSAKESLDNLAKEMKSGAEGPDQDELEIDMKAVRQILQNLIRMSFAQEDLIDAVKKTSIADPRYVENIKEQQKLKNDGKMIADSLFALSKRLSVLASTVNKEIDGMNRNMESAIASLENRGSSQAVVNQQYVMMGANNLALMLNEVMQELQKQQAEAQAKQGDGSCNKPGNKPGKKPGKKPGQGMGMQLGDIMSKQQQLGDAMKQLKEKMDKKGKEGKDGKDGKGKDGKDGKDGKEGKGDGESDQGGGESEQMARIAAQQAALRKQLNDINEQLRKEGKSNPNLTKIQSDMDRNETEIVNKRMTNDMLRRQSEIMSRLLEVKDAMRQQEQGEERESNAAKDVPREMPQQLKDILKDKQSIIDYYKTVPPDLKPYYKKMVEDYFNLIK